MNGLTIDLPEYNLWREQLGTVVEILADDAAFEVEFSDRNGRIDESFGLRSNQSLGEVTSCQDIGVGTRRFCGAIG
ncbi:hypothetical protein C7B61_16275 [filamentous cyanobacterium CCP1]|nr:hypothetical protein C7B76_09960 [filamentous cyanobacterium CCP2]PSB61194.1 hypothetical protein C7B61_16275 [filamentous cyanobacterium CCP1]